jgi:hypothetical protein
MMERKQNPHQCFLRTRPTCYISERDIRDAGYHDPQCGQEIMIHGTPYELVSRDNEVGNWMAELLAGQGDLT